MCAVSMVHDYFRQNVRPDQWTPHLWYKYNSVIHELAYLDAALDQPDCEDPEKAAWMKEVQALIDHGDFAVTD